MLNFEFEDHPYQSWTNDDLTRHKMPRDNLQNSKIANEIQIDTHHNTIFKIARSPWHDSSSKTIWEDAAL